MLICQNNIFFYSILNNYLKKLAKLLVYYKDGLYVVTVHMHKMLYAGTVPTYKTWYGGMVPIAAKILLMKIFWG